MQGERGGVADISGSIDSKALEVFHSGLYAFDRLIRADSAFVQWPRILRPVPSRFSRPPFSAGLELVHQIIADTMLFFMVMLQFSQ